jgi:hypothetical protein
VLDVSEVGGSVIGSHAAFVVAKDHVHDPVQSWVLGICYLIAIRLHEIANMSSEPAQGNTCLAVMA